jgi:hypothetical protein
MERRLRAMLVVRSVLIKDMGYMLKNEGFMHYAGLANECYH